MKRKVLLVISLLVATMTVALVPGAPAPQDPVELVPAGALLVVEAKDFASLLASWNRSPEKKQWLESDNFGVFSRSRLFLRLADAHAEFAAAAGLSPDMALIQAVAGKESAVGLYNIGKLEFLYVTRLPLAHTTESVLWQKRASFEPRQAAGLTYYVRVEPESKRVVAFAATENYLLLATREDLLAGALTALASGATRTVKDEPWYDQALRAAGPAGALRLVMNLEAVSQTPHFRSYWVQRNVSELRAYPAAVSDLHFASGEIHEERVLLRSLAGEAEAKEEKELTGNLGEVLRLVPEDFGLYRAWSRPTVAEALDLLEQKLLAPRTAAPPARREFAPAVSLDAPRVGSEANLETLINQEPPKVVSGAFAPEPLRRLFESARLRGLLHVQASRMLPGDVFVGQQSGIVLLGSSDWKGEEVRASLADAVTGLWTTSHLGIQWVERQQAGQVYHQLHGLARLMVATRGRVLIVADGPGLLTSVLARVAIPAVAPRHEGVYAAGFQHSREREHFLRMMPLLDYPGIRTDEFGEHGEGREPRFFSENLGSLSRVLARMEGVSIVVREGNSSVMQTVTYKWAQ